MRGYDILAVNISHLVVVEDVFRRFDGQDSAEIVALLLPPELESLIQLARLRPATRLGMVCDLMGTLQSMSGMVAAYNPGVRTSGALTSDHRGLRRLVREVDVILVTPSASVALNAYVPKVPLISVLATAV